MDTARSYSPGAQPGTTRIELAYGKTGLPIELPDHNLTIIEPQFVEGLADEAAALRAALHNPINSSALRDLIRPGNTVSIVFCDITRPMPNDRVLPVLLAELEAGGIRRDDIVLINATGSHRENTPDELVTMLGAHVAHNYRIVNHDSFDKSGLNHVGHTTFGGEAWINSEFLRADIKILTGFIEPHFFAGFSGGPKMIAPGMAGIETIMHLHNARMVGDPNAVWGVTFGNPIHDSIREICAIVQPTFNLNVTLNKNHQITNVFAGDVWESHKIGCEYVRQTAMQAVPERFDIVITTNSGYPLDMNLYQTIKGMSAAQLIVKQGGAIISASECSDGIPEHGNYKDILQMARTPAELLDIITAPGFLMHDQWEAHVQAKIQTWARVFLKNGYLSDAQVRAAMLEPVDDIAATVARLKAEVYGPDARVCVLPQGPQTIPYVTADVREAVGV